MMQKIKKIRKMLGLSQINLIIITSLGIGNLVKAEAVVGSMNEANAYIRAYKAAHFLSQATMGPTMDEINALANRINQIGEDEAFNEWIDSQFAQPMTSSYDRAQGMLQSDGFPNGALQSSYPTLDLPINNYQFYSFWDQAMNAQDQLRVRTTWALSQIFVAGGANSNRFNWLNPLVYKDLLAENAFGNYRNLLEDITYSAEMGVFLSFVRNDKGDPDLQIFPDENYAREIMQLFSVGVFLTNRSGRPVTEDGQALPIDGEYVENYTNDDITGLARVFTGLSYNPRNPAMNFFTALPADRREPLIMFEDHHHQGEKTFLGRTIPAGQPGNEDISDALDILFNYTTTPQFIAQRLIQRFTSSTPHAFYINRVASKFVNNGAGERGDFKAVIRQILVDPAARDAINYTTTTLSNGNILVSADVNTSTQQSVLNGKLKEPVLQLSQFFRFFEVDSQENSTTGSDGYFKPATLGGILSQDVSGSASVFNHYNADFVPAVGPAANRVRTSNPFALPEFELLPNFAVSLNEGIRLFSLNGEVNQRATTSSQPAILDTLLEFSDEDEEQDSFSWLVDKFDTYLCSGTMSNELKTELINELDDLVDTSQNRRFANALAILFGSADFAVAN